MYKHILSCCTLLAFTSLLWAQPGIYPETFEDNIEKAELLLTEGSYYNAVTYYIKALEIKNNDPETLYKTAEAYRQGRAYQEASKYYATVIEQAKKDDVKEAYPLLQYHYGSMLMQLGDYRAAEDALTTFLASYGGAEGKKYAELAKAMNKGCQMATSPSTPILKLNSSAVLPKGINSRYTESAPVPYEDGILYSSLSSNKYLGIRDQKKFAKVYVASVNDAGEVTGKKTFSRAMNIKGSHVSNPSFSPDGKRLYFTVCDQQIEDNRVNCTIYSSQKLKNTWDKAEKLGSPINLDGYESSTPYVAKGDDGSEVIYFSSNRPGGFGEMDIWASKRGRSGNFSAPVNLGGSINTAGIETTPFLDDRTGRAESRPELYFSSNGHPGYGGLDIYRAAKASTNLSSWENVNNIGSDLNSPADEQYFIISKADKTQAYFVSNKEGSMGIESKTCCDDIFSASISAPALATVTGTIFDEKNKPVVGAKVDLYDLTDGVRTLIGTVTTTADGKYNFNNLPAGKDYVLEVSKSGYKPQTHKFSTKDLNADKVFNKDFYLKKIPPPPPPPPSGLTLSGVTYSDKGRQGRTSLDGVKVDIYQIDPRTGRETLFKTIYSANGGNYRTVIPVGYRYKVVGSEPKHLTISEFVDLTNYKPRGQEELRRDLDLVLQYKQIGLAFKLENIYYDFNSAKLRPESIATLTKVKRLLDDNPNIIVELGSHTDSKGSDTYNRRLSKKRAESVVNWLTQNGLSPSRLKPQGYGEVEPVASNKNSDGSDNPEGRQLNRRTELKVIGEINNIKN